MTEQQQGTQAHFASMRVYLDYDLIHFYSFVIAGLCIIRHAVPLLSVWKAWLRDCSTIASSECLGNTMYPNSDYIFSASRYCRTVKRGEILCHMEGHIRGAAGKVIRGTTAPGSQGIQELEPTGSLPPPPRRARDGLPDSRIQS